MIPPASVPDPLSREDEFFIGWLPVPRRYARVLLPVAIVLVLVAGATAILVGVFQRNPGAGRWDDGRTYTFEGSVAARPYALFRTAGEHPGDPPRTFLLVEEGKFGAGARVERLLQGKASQTVQITGTVLHRDGRWMIELIDGEDGLKPLSGEDETRRAAQVWSEPQVVAERAVLSGEIIDPKCYLGAMKPGGGKTHKACASLCISGGIPPMFVTRDGDGREIFYLLTKADGEAANESVLPFVGDAVDVTGRVERMGDLLLLRLATAGIRRR